MFITMRYQLHSEILILQKSVYFSMSCLLHHYWEQKMSYIQLDYETWNREECYDMFDYTERKNIRFYPKMFIKTPGRIIKNQDTYELVFIQNESNRDIPPNYEVFLKIQHAGGHFFIVNQQKEIGRQPLCSIAVRNQGLKIKEGNKIRLGKAQIDIKSLVWTTQNCANHYEMLKKPKIAEKQSVFDSSFYSQKQKASILQTNPACRYCYSKSIDDQNPFIILCNCSGSTKYIHLHCLVEWVRKRSGVPQDYPKGRIYCAQAKAFTCEVCKSLYKLDRIIKQVFDVDQNQLQQYAVFLVHVQVPLIYVVDLKRQESILIGRNLQNGMVINQLSVSRKHCILNIDRKKKELLLTDLSSKFGSVVEINISEITGEHEYQKGRTKMKFTKKRKISFFQRLGFCSLEENLSNQRKI